MGTACGTMVFLAETDGISFPDKYDSVPPVYRN
jgi:hypothetical protein